MAKIYDKYPGDVTNETNSGVVPAESGEKDQRRQTLESLWRASVLAILTVDQRKKLATGDSSVLEDIPIEEPMTLGGHDENSLPTVLFVIGGNRNTKEAEVKYMEVKWLSYQPNHGLEPLRVVIDLSVLDSAFVTLRGDQTREIKEIEAREALTQIIKSSGLTPEELDAYNPFDKQG
ncbi:hypothetical protein HY857_00540 [Candidatus Saccharibacteria bacterium]|nr:hypothetical protein [Candidatus Saccharibacteria bacterium]